MIDLAPRQIHTPERVRTYNRRLFVEFSEFHAGSGTSVELLCECVDLDCDLMVCVEHGDAERSLAEPATFVVSTPHVPDGWRLVEDHGKWATASPLVSGTQPPVSADTGPA